MEDTKSSSVKSKPKPKQAKLKKQKSKAGRPAGPTQPLTQQQYQLLVLFAKEKKTGAGDAVEDNKVKNNKTGKNKPYSAELKKAIAAEYGDDSKKSTKSFSGDISVFVSCSNMCCC
jgi:hypothetical protein